MENQEEWFSSTWSKPGKDWFSFTTQSAFMSFPDPTFPSLHHRWKLPDLLGGHMWTVNLKELWLIEKPMEKILPVSTAFPQPELPAIVRTSSNLNHRTGVGAANPILPPSMQKTETSRNRVGEPILHLHCLCSMRKKLPDAEALLVLIETYFC